MSTGPLPAAVDEPNTTILTPAFKVEIKNMAISTNINFAVNPLYILGNQINTRAYFLNKFRLKPLYNFLIEL